jgi:hypothetical protein
MAAGVRFTLHPDGGIVMLARRAAAALDQSEDIARWKS